MDFKFRLLKLWAFSFILVTRWFDLIKFFNLATTVPKKVPNQSPEQLLFRILYMSFDRFLLAVESCNLSQAYKRIVRLYSFPKLNDG